MMMSTKKYVLPSRLLVRIGFHISIALGSWRGQEYPGPSAAATYDTTNGPTAFENIPQKHISGQSMAGAVFSRFQIPLFASSPLSLVSKLTGQSL